jgi:hypothetical protein
LALGLKNFEKKGKVYTIDTYSKDIVNGKSITIKGKINHDDPFGYKKVSIENFKTLGVFDFIEVCEGYTWDWASELTDKKFRLIFIDADHGYNACKKDFELWSPMLEEDGELIFHDCHLDSVNKVINELGSNWKLKDHLLLTKSFVRKGKL